MNIGKKARVLVAAAVSMGGLAFAGTADAHHPSGTGCGQVITANLTLTHDVGPCPDHGVVVAASSITLDLNGFKIIGDGVVNDASGDVGILLDGVTGVIVTDSTAPNATTGLRSNQVAAFNAGVAVLNGSSNNTIEKLNVTGNVGTASDFGDGIVVADSSGTSLSNGNKIKSNVVTGNGPYDGIVLLRNSDYNTIEGNVVQANNVTHQDIGIRLEPDTANPNITTDNNRVTGNTVTGSTIDGISLLGASTTTSGNEIDNNTVTANGLNGIRLNTRVTSTNVHHNTVCANGGAGIKVGLTALSNNIHDNSVGAELTSGCLPNNPVVVPPLSVNPLLPPHGDLHDDNVNCDDTFGMNDNTWQNNAHVTEFVTLGGPPPAEMTAINTTPLPDGLPDYVCTD